jgi:hypothetical protein
MAPKKISISRKKTGKTEPNNIYTKYYPSILKPNFSHKIATHKIFKKYKLTTNTKKLNELYKAFETNKPMSDDLKKTTANIYILKPTQKLLRNFMSPYTPYRSLLIYHEMGVGKTCTAITIAESLKTITTNSDTKIYVIRPDELERQIFNVNVIKDKKPLFQCTGDSYLQNPEHSLLIEKCEAGNDYSCEQLKSKVDKDIRKIYEFSGSQTWANKVEKELDMKTKGIENEKDKIDKEKQIVSNMFDNAVIIVDEAHALRSNNELDKIVPPILTKVLKYSSNLRLIFLTATPIYDKPQNIISIINYFLLNDKRPVMKESDVFDKNGNLKPDGRHILEENTRGYISFLRGSNPFEFPIRLSAKYNIPNEMFNIKQYPKLDIYGKRLEKENHIKHLELVDCPMKGAQLELFTYHMKNDIIPEIDEDELDKMESINPLFDTSLSDDDENSNINDISKSSRKLSHKSSHKSSSSQSRIELARDVGNLFERQLSNFIYQSLGECNKNLKLVSGDIGFKQIGTKQHGKFTYEFNDPNYGKRFKLPELANWSSKISKVIERVLVSTGPVFIYSFFSGSGIIPLAFALEMNGYKRYKQHGTPLLENSHKDNTYRGDYIIYSGNQPLSLYAKEYLNNERGMINEKSVKVFIGTSKASEGLNLFGYREVHILDPWHNINLTEQTIGRVIRTGSHLHLPPQERNVTVYQYVSTLPDRESFDLKMYRTCEDKAIKAGIVEKILKENAFDCELNKSVNLYDKEYYNYLIPLKTSNNKNIKISLADVEYSRSCFYMKDCNFKCIGDYNDKDSEKYKDNDKDKDKKNDITMPIMRFNFDKDVDEFRNLIIQLMKSSFNIKIVNLKEYLKKIMSGTLDDKSYIKPILQVSKKYTKSKKLNQTDNRNDNHNEWEDEEAFSRAIQDIVNMNITITDKFGRKGKIVLAGENLRLIPEQNLEPNISIQKQNMKTPSDLITDIDLKSYITKLDDEHKKLVMDESLNYTYILDNNIINMVEKIYYGTDKEYIFNIKLKMDEIVDLVINKLIYSYKLVIIKTFLEKYIKNIKLSINETKIENSIKNYIVFMNDIFPDYKLDSDSRKNIYGFIIQNNNKLELFYLTPDKKFEKNQGNLKKVIENKLMHLNKTASNKLYGFLKYEKNNLPPVFKITDIIAKGEKKSVKGITCRTKKTIEIKKNLNKLDDKVLRTPNANYSIRVLCNDIEILMKRNDTIKKDGKKWYYSPEEYYIVFESGS